MKLTKKMVTEAGAKIGVAKVREMMEAHASTTLVLFFVAISKARMEGLANKLFPEGSDDKCEIDVTADQIKEAASDVCKDALGKNKESSIGNLMDVALSLSFVQDLADALLKEGGGADA